MKNWKRKMCLTTSLARILVIYYISIIVIEYKIYQFQKVNCWTLNIEHFIWAQNQHLIFSNSISTHNIFRYDFYLIESKLLLQFLCEQFLWNYIQLISLFNWFSHIWGHFTEQFWTIYIPWTMNEKLCSDSVHVDFGRVVN